MEFVIVLSIAGSKGDGLETPRLVRPPFGFDSLIFGCCLYTCWGIACLDYPYINFLFGFRE